MTFSPFDKIVIVSIISEQPSYMYIDTIISGSAHFSLGLPYGGYG